MATENIKIVYQIDTTDLDKLLAKFGNLSEEEREQIRLLNEIDKKSQSTINNQSKGFNSLNSVVSKIGITIAAAFAFDKVKDFTSEVIKTTSNFQKFEAVLTNTLGSSSKAQKALQMIQDFAQKTPFSVEQLTDSFVKLANRGIVANEVQLRQLGDLASATGKEFNQLTEALLDAMTGEFERLKEFGIKASNEGDRVKFTFKGVTTEVANTEESIKKYVMSLGDLKGVSGGMNAISQTLGGQISNLGDNFDKLKLSIGERLSGAFSLAISGLNSLITGMTNFIAPAKSVEQQVYKEQNALNLLVNQITTTNQGSNERKVLMEKLNAEYPFFLKNMDKENATNEQLIGHLNKVNDLYIKKAFIMSKEKEIALIADEGARSMDSQAKAQEAILQVANEISKVNRAMPLFNETEFRNYQNATDFRLKALITQNVLEKRIAESNKDLIDVQKSGYTQGQAEIRSRIRQYESLLGIVNNGIETYNKEKNQIDAAQKSIDKRTKQINETKKQLGGIFDDPIEVKKQQTILSKAQYEDIEKRLKMLADFDLRERIAKQKHTIELLELQKEQNNEVLQNTNISELKRIELLTSNFELEKQINEAKKQNELNTFEVVEQKGKLYSTYSVQRKKLTKTEELNIETASGRELLKIIQSYNIEKDKLELQVIEKERQRSEERRKVRFENEINEQNKINTLILLGELDTLQKSDEAFKKYQYNKTQLLNQTQKEQLDKRIEFLNIELDKLLPTELEKRKEIEKEIVQLKKDSLNLQLSEAEANVQKEIELQRKKREEIAQIEQKALELGTAITNALFDNQNQRRQREIEDIQRQRDWELQTAGDNANKKAYINDKYAQKERQLKEQQARSDRDKAVFDILVNTSVAVVKSLPNLVLAAFTGGLGAIQLASVLARPLPKFFKGTEYLERGNNPSGIDTIPILANEGERIIPTEINRQLRGIKNTEIPELVHLGRKAKSKEPTINVNLENIPQSKIVMDKEGFNEYLINQNSQTKILNHNNSL